MQTTTYQNSQQVKFSQHKPHSVHSLKVVKLKVNLLVIGKGIFELNIFIRKITFKRFDSP